MTIRLYLLNTFIALNLLKASIHTKEMVSLPSKNAMKFRKDAISAGMTEQLVMNVEGAGIPFRLISYQVEEERVDAAPVELSESLEKDAKNAIYKKVALDVDMVNGSSATNVSMHSGEHNN